MIYLHYNVSDDIFQQTSEAPSTEALIAASDDVSILRINGDDVSIWNPRHKRWDYVDTFDQDEAYADLREDDRDGGDADDVDEDADDDAE